MARTALGWAVIGVGVIAIVLAVLRANQQLQAINFHAFDDWRTYARAVERWMAGDAIYAPFQMAGPYELRDTLLTGFTYPPAAVPLFVPFAFGELGITAWLVLNLGGFVLALTAVLDREFGRVTPLAFGLALLGLAAFPPFGNAVASGNINLGIAAVLLWCWAGLRPASAAVLAGVGAIVKLFPGLIAAWSVRVGGWRQLAIAGGAAAAVAVVTLPIIGLGPWADFATALINARPECSPQSLSIPCGLGGLVGPGPARAVGILLTVALLVIVVRARSPFVAYAALAGALLAPVVDMHPHYWLFAWVVAFVGVVRTFGARHRRALRAA